jgi:glycosyltransferase involved in cell wall biosynthesis
LKKKIGIDFHLLSGKYQGSRTYLVNIIPELLILDKENYYFVYLNDKNAFSGLTAKNQLAMTDSYTLREYFFKSPLFRLGINIPLMECRDRLDIFHAQYISPLFSFARCVVTIHDILYETHPQFFSKTFVARSRFFIPLSARRADKILTDSLFSKSQLVEKYRLGEEKIEVIHGGVDTGKFNRLDKDKAKEYIYEKYGKKNFLLNVGRLEPRKNQLALIQAYDDLLRTMKMDEELLIIGPKDFQFELLYQYIRENGLEKKISIFNDIEDDELPLFYKAAKIFIYPTFAEGFGLPVVEAMACGLPVIGSNTSSIPEIVGEAGLLIDPYNVEDLKEGIKRLLLSPILRDQLSLKAVERSSRFTWKEAALKTLEVYNNL